MHCACGRATTKGVQEPLLSWRMLHCMIFKAFQENTGPTCGSMQPLR